MTTQPFIFGIPLIARAASTDWEVVEALLGLTLRSIAGQTQRGVRIVVAGHDRPRTTGAAIEFLQVDWPVESVRADNLDSGRKKHAISQHVLESGGGLLMFVDADDWVDTRVAETARAVILPDQVGGLIERGFATDFRLLRACSLPHPDVFEGGFHEVCGSCSVAQLKPGHPDLIHRDPTAVLHEHYRWIEMAREHGVDWARLGVSGNYLVNTSANHSEVHGPFATWRRSFSDAVACSGTPLDDAFLARFGLDLCNVEEVRHRLNPIQT